MTGCTPKWQNRKKLGKRKNTRRWRSHKEKKAKKESKIKRKPRVTLSLIRKILESPLKTNLKMLIQKIWMRTIDGTTGMTNMVSKTSFTSPW